MIAILRADTLSMEKLLPDTAGDDKVEQVVEAIIADVRKRGDIALMEYAKRFDGAELNTLVVSEAEFEEAEKAVNPALLGALKQAKQNIEDFHRRQLRQGYEIREREGIVLGQRILPLEKVGLYVPGGTASYPSSVLMNAVPAKLAKVKQLVMVTPPGKDGKLNPLVLCAARIAGINLVIKTGGAQAIAALAFGTESVPRVDKIVGPGNSYVATAKRRVFGLVDIDMVAGPSEILVIADEKSNPRHIAADMLSQAEHDTLASSWLLTESEALAQKVQQELERQIPTLERSDIARQSIDNKGKIILVKDMEQALDIANRIAPEHLELMVDEPFGLLPKVSSAGSVFLGRYAPEALGDYWAGPNHTLPTSGTARFSSPLSVDDFVKTSQYLYYDKDALIPVAADIARLARAEGLTAHARSAESRFEEEQS